MLHSFQTTIEDIFICPMSSHDSESYRNIRNLEPIRGFFYSQEIITHSKQKLWYASYESNEKEFMFSIFLDGYRYIGGFGIYDFDKNNMCAEFGRILISPEFQGIGYGAKATRGAIFIAHKEMKLRKLFLNVKKNNCSAIKAYLNSGFKIVGECDASYQMEHDLNY